VQVQRVLVLVSLELLELLELLLGQASPPPQEQKQEPWSLAQPPLPL
jgi:hypothetical protein